MACPTLHDGCVQVASDGLFAEESRGGGGGLDNDNLVELLQVCAVWPHVLLRPRHVLTVAS